MEFGKFVVSEIKNKGKGMIAVSNIKQGELIYTESPLISIERNKLSLSLQLDREFDNLSEFQRTLFSDLAYQSNGSKLDIFKTNSICNTLNRKCMSHLFPVICRANHSCEANSHWKWDEKTQKEQLIAAFDIETGQEITANYLGMSTMLVFNVRQQLLQKNWGFKCECNLCLKPEKQRISLDQLIIKRGDLMLKSHKIKDENYEIILELIEMTNCYFNDHPLYLFEHHLQALKCCIRSEEQHLQQKIEHHREQVLINWTKFMGNVDLPDTVNCLL